MKQNSRRQTFIIAASLLTWLTVASFCHRAKGQDAQVKDRFGITSYIMVVDGFLGLSIEQHNRLAEQFAENWQNSDNHRAHMMPQNSLELLPAADEEAKAVLNEKQLAMAELLVENNPFNFAVGDRAQAWTDDTQEFLTIASQLLLEELKSNCELSLSQEKKLRVALKGATQAVIRKRQEYALALSGDPNLNTTALYGLETVINGPVNQLRNSELWQKSLAKVLDDSQLASLEKLADFRMEKYARCAAASITVSLDSSPHEFSSDQYEKFVEPISAEVFKVLKQKVRDGEAPNYYSAMRTLDDIALETYEAHLPPEIWEAVSREVARIQEWTSDAQDEPVEEPEDERN